MSDSKPDRVTRALKKLGIHAEPRKTFVVQTETEYVAAWVAMFDQPPSANALRNAREAGKIV